MRILFYPLFFLLFAWNVNSQIVINEISYNPPEANTDSLEYIELYNAGDIAVDITGWHFLLGVEDTLPSIILAPGEYFVTAFSASAMMNVFHVNVHQWSAGALNNSGEKIVLADAFNNTIDSVLYDDADPWPVEADGNGPSLELIDPFLDNNDGANWQFSGGATGVIIEGNEVKGTPLAENSSGGTVGPAVTVLAENLLFNPQHVVIPVGDSVRWINPEPVAHNVNGTQATFPDNPESFFSGLPAPGIWQFDHEFNTEGLYNYQCDPHVFSGMTGTVAVYDPNGYTPFPLLHLRLTDGNGLNIFYGVPTVVTGVVHGLNYNPSGYSFYIVNENNVGINVFSFDPGTYVVNEGDEVEIKGVIDQFNGLLEIIPDEINVLSTGNPLVTPEFFVELGELTEGSHIALAPFTIDSIVPDLSGFNVYVKDDQGQPVTIRVDFDSGMTADDVANANAVRGIGSQFDNTFPYTSGYQIFALEFLIIDGLPVISKDAITMHPNPASSMVSITSDFEMNLIEIYSMEGKLIKVADSERKNDIVDVSAIQPGLYLVKIMTDAGVWSSLVSIVK